MQNRTTILSINMLISGVEEMEKSILSLQPFREQLSCELILTDTGCSPAQRAFAEKYADKVIDFTWINDFAAARNAGLKEAGGEWFMYIDDDEWFEDPSEIIDFFTSGEYKKYNCASYAVRNYSNLKGTMYNDSYPSRMVKMEEKTRFVGKVHEYLEPFKLPKKTFPCFVHHYGYAYASKKEQEEHAKRNLVLLEEMCKNHPGDPRWMCQLAQEYYAGDRIEDVIAYTEGALKQWRLLKDKIEYAPAHMGALYAYLMIAHEVKADYAGMGEWIDKALSEKEIWLDFMAPTRAFCYMAKARMHSRLGEVEACHDAFATYFSLYQKLKDDREMIEAGAAAVVADVFQEQVLYGTILQCVGMLIRSGDLNLAREAFFTMDWQDKRLLKQLTWEEEILQAACESPADGTILEIIQTLVLREDGMKEMYVAFLESEIRYKEEKAAEYLLQLYRIVATLPPQHRFILLSKLIVTDVSESGIDKKSAITGCFADYINMYPEDLPLLREEVWDILAKYEVPVDRIFDELDPEFLYNGLSVWTESADLQELVAFDGRWHGLSLQNAVIKDVLWLKCVENYFRFCPLCNKSLTEVEPILSDVMQAIANLAKSASFHVVEEDFLRCAIALKAALAKGSAADVEKAFGELEDSFFLLREGVAYYHTLYAAEKKNVSSEMDQLATALKQNIRVLMQSGKQQEAYQALQQLEQFLPDDPEIAFLKRELE